MLKWYIGRKKSKLKPCPFCGSENVVIHKWSITNSYFVMCKDCPARMDDLREDNKGTSKPITLKQAVKIWNTRKTESTDIPRNLYNEGWKYITCYVGLDGHLCPMGVAKNKEYATKIAKRHKHVLCKLVKLADYSKR